MSEVSCARAELLLAEHALGTDATLPRDMVAHLESCAACLRLARELEEPMVADALGDAAEHDDDRELAVVSPDHYVRGREIGRGGMGRIVRARDRRLGRAVAIKELLDERLRDRFEHEARLTARLQHPAIVSVHEAGRWPSGAPFYAMKYVAGKPLDQIIASNPTLAGRLAYLPNLITVVEAIAYAHSLGVVHRDLKPHNIVVGPFGETVVLDWGLAKELGATGELPASPYRDADPRTLAGSGTPAYMPPEQAQGEAVDERADVYALGATLHHLVAGRPAIERALPAQLPGELRAIVARAMAPAREDRYRTAAELAEELKRYQAGQLIGAYRYTRLERVRRFLRRHRVPASLTFSFLVALGVVGAVSVRRVVYEKRRAENSAARATQALANGYAERGRQHMLAGEPMRALPLLHAALAGGVDTPELRFLLGGARRIAENDRPSEGIVHHEVAVSPDGALRAVARDGLRLVSTDSELVVATLAAEDAHAPQFSPDGKWLAATLAGRRKAALRLWSAPDWQPRVTFTWGRPETTAFAPDSQRIAASHGGEVVIAALDGTELARLPVGEVVRELLWTPDGKRLVVVPLGLEAATVWDVASARRLAVLDSAFGHDAALTPSGRHFVTATLARRREVVVCDLATGARLAAPTAASPTQLYPDGDRVTVEDDGEDGSNQGVELVAHGSELVVRLVRLGALVGRRKSDLKQFSFTEEKLGDQGRSDILHVALDPGAEQARFDAHDHLLTVGSPRLLAALWDLRTGQLVRSLAREEGAEVLAVLTPAGELQALIHGADGGDRVWDAATGELRAIALPPGGFAGAGSRDGRVIVKWAAPRTPLVFDRTTGARHEKLGFVAPPSLSPDGAWLVAPVAGQELSALVYDVAHARPRTRLDLDYALHWGDFTPDGKQLVTYGYLGQIELRDLDSGRVAGEFRDGDARILDADLSGDGRLLLTAREDGHAKLWSVATQEVLWIAPAAVLERPRALVAAVALDARGVRAYVSGVVYDLSPDPRGVDEIGAMVAKRSPYQVVDGRLVAR